jgi:Catalase
MNNQVPQFHPYAKAPPEGQFAFTHHNVGFPVAVARESASSDHLDVRPRGQPPSLRHVNGYGSHTNSPINAAGERVWVKYYSAECPVQRRLGGGGSEDLRQNAQQLGALEWFSQRPSRAERDGGSGIHAVAGIEQAGHRNDRNLGVVLLQFRDDCDPARTGHVDVGDHQPRRRESHGREPGTAVRRGADAVTGRVQPVGQRFAHNRVVFNDEDLGDHFHVHLRPIGEYGTALWSDRSQL